LVSDYHYFSILVSLCDSFLFNDLSYGSHLFYFIFDVYFFGSMSFVAVRQILSCFCRLSKLLTSAY